jgi:hypothetical protein
VRNIKIPIFIITKDRMTVLQESIKSYHDYIKTPFEIVIHDNGTTFPATSKYLRSLEKNGIKIYWTKGCKTKRDELNSVGYSVKDFLNGNPAPNYIVTDPDVALDNVKGDILEFYSAILKRHIGYTAISPMPRMDDIPICYPLKNELRRRERARRISKKHTIMHKGKRYRCKPTVVDTYFGMYRKNFPFQRKNPGIQVPPPYGARHLDWYLDPNNLKPDQLYYIQMSGRKGNLTRSISRWGGYPIRRYMKHNRIKYD